MIEGLTYLNFAFTPFPTYFTATGNAFQDFQIYRVLLHYGFSASLALGFGASMIVLAVGPIRRGESWSNWAMLAIGLVPAVGAAMVTAVELFAWMPFLVVPSMRLNEVHLYELSIPVFWLAGLLLTE